MKNNINRNKEENRIREIEESIRSMRKKTYKNNEVLPELLKAQKEMTDIAFPKSVAIEHPRMSDVFYHLQRRNRELGGIADEELKAFQAGSEEFCTMIGREIAGTSGEKAAVRSLETINAQHVLLHNVELKNGNNRAELDAVVITSKAIFLIEVKNSSHDMIIDEKGNYFRAHGTMTFDYNIGEKVNNKEYLLRNALKKRTLFEGEKKLKLINLVAFANSKMCVENMYKYVKTCFLSQLPHIIEDFDGEDIYTLRDIDKMAEVIRDSECTEEYPIKLDFKQFREDFAVLIAALENAEETKEKRENLRSKASEMFTWLFQINLQSKPKEVTK